MFQGQYDHAMLRNYRARAMSRSLKFGYSRDFTLAWVDFLVQDEAEIEAHSLKVGKPSLPTVRTACCLCGLWQLMCVPTGTALQR